MCDLRIQSAVHRCRAPNQFVTFVFYSRNNRSRGQMRLELHQIKKNTCKAAHHTAIFNGLPEIVAEERFTDTSHSSLSFGRCWVTSHIRPIFMYSVILLLYINISRANFFFFQFRRKSATDTHSVSHRRFILVIAAIYHHSSTNRKGVKGCVSDWKILC